MTGIAGAFIAFAVAVSSGSVAAPSSAVTGDLTFGDRGAAVTELNASLARAGFNPDAGDHFGKKTRHAVYAFQKHFELPTTGVFTPLMWDLLAKPIDLVWRPEADRVEVDLGKQVLYVVEDHKVIRIVPVSSGNGKPYFGNGHTDIARTPEGKFRFQRRIRGWRKSYLGELWKPYYFYRGYAIHGSRSVPNYPASHGCIRVPMWEMDLLFDRFQVGQTVYIYGKRTAAPPAGLNARDRKFI